MESRFSFAIHMTQGPSLTLPTSFQQLLAHLLPRLEGGYVALIEANQLQTIHRELHLLMVEAVHNNWAVTLVDFANCLNPQLISNMCFDYNLHSEKLLQEIYLARPFQIHQAVGIVKQLAAALDSETQTRLIIVTDISSLYFDEALANEDPDFPLPQLELLRQSMGILQSLAVKGHIVLLTDQTTRRNQPDGMGSKVVPSMSTKYSAKAHISAEILEYKTVIERKNHPYLPPTKKILTNPVVVPLQYTRQTSLNAFF